MKISEKEKIWYILSKYNNSLSSFCDSLSNIIQERSTKLDFVTIFKNYQNIDICDVDIIDQILGNKIMFAMNS
jgi:hypothetical protein